MWQINLKIEKWLHQNDLLFIYLFFFYIKLICVCFYYIPPDFSAKTNTVTIESAFVSAGQPACHLQAGRSESAQPSAVNLVNLECRHPRLFFSPALTFCFLSSIFAQCSDSQRTAPQWSNASRGPMRDSLAESSLLRRLTAKRSRSSKLLTAAFWAVTRF